MFNADLMHKLIVYGNGVTNPTITIPHGMFTYHEVIRTTVKMIGYRSCLRDMMGQSYPIYACTRANLAH